MWRDYRKKPIIIQAVKWDGTFLPECLQGRVAQRGTELWIATLEGSMKADPGDWVIRGIKGELYPCKPDIFEATYEVVGEEAPHA